MMNRYASTYGHRSGLPVFWRRPIPVYLAALLMAAAVAASFFAGRTSLPKGSSMAERDLLEERSTIPSHQLLADTLAARALEWETAPSELF